jgi:hypothetical protein
VGARPTKSGSPQPGQPITQTRPQKGLFDHFSRVSDAYAFEAFAQGARDPAARSQRDAWYIWLAGQYAALIRQVSPGVDAAQAEVRAYQVLTLILGGWITFSCSRPELLGGQADAMKSALIEAVNKLLADPPGS